MSCCGRQPYERNRRRVWERIVTSPAYFSNMLNTSDAGWRVFLASLFVLVLLRAPGIANVPRAHLNLRIFMLGMCVGGFVLSFTSSLVSSAMIAVAIWAPKPILQWRQRQAQSPPNPTVCPPIPSAGGGRRGPPAMALARAWLHAWLMVHVHAFRFIWRAVDRFNDGVFSLFIRLAMMSARSRESLHQAIARGDARKVAKLVKQKPAALAEPDEQGRTPLHIALEGLKEVRTHFSGRMRLSLSLARSLSVSVFHAPLHLARVRSNSGRRRRRRRKKTHHPPRRGSPC